AEQLGRLWEVSHEAFPRPVCGRRVAGDDGFRRHTLRYAALRADHRALADTNMPDQTRLAADRHIILEHRAARDADLRDDDAVAADLDVVADLDEVVDLRAV